LNILKPQILYSKRLENGKLLNNIKDEDIEYLYFENEQCNLIELCDLKFECCKFNHICIQNGKLEKLEFKDIVFENCDFSNTEFINSSFVSVLFIKHLNLLLSGTNATYVNLSMASIENILFKNTTLKNSYFQETRLKNIYFDNADLTQAQFFKTSLKNVDLSSCKIERIAISIEDIKGAIIDQLQAIDLLYLLGVKIK